MSAHRIAVVGSGPSGLYTVAALLASAEPLHIDVIDRLPTPYGLVRYGVAPDHAKMKAVTRVLAKPFANDRVRFLGNVEIGRDLTHTELVEHYDAVVYASGTEHDRRLGIPGEDLPGSVGSAEFVRWYNGYPDAGEFALDAEQVAVVGAGNVALDVARVLGRTADEMCGTDVPARVLETLRRSTVRDVHVLIRRTRSSPRPSCSSSPSSPTRTWSSTTAGPGSPTQGPRATAGSGSTWRLSGPSWTPRPGAAHGGSTCVS
jgi:ferredoxin--NADP+ reductase